MSPVDDTQYAFAVTKELMQSKDPLRSAICAGLSLPEAEAFLRMLGIPPRRTPAFQSVWRYLQERGEAP